MMDLQAAFLLSLATILLGLSPGPAVFAVVSYTLTLPLRRVMFFILGIIVGDIFFAFLAMLGLAALAQSFGIVFIFLKVLGGAYLVYLGVLSWITLAHANIFYKQNEGVFKLFLSGFLLTSSNPKDLLFFVGFLPAFLDLKHVSFFGMMSAVLVIAASFFITLSFYALTSFYVKKWLQNTKSLAVLHRLAGSMLCILGIFVAFS